MICKVTNPLAILFSSACLLNGSPFLVKELKIVSGLNLVQIALRKPWTAAFLQKWPSVVLPTLYPHTRQRTHCHLPDFSRTKINFISGKIITIYAPMIYTAPCLMFWLLAYPSRRQVGGSWALEFESFLGPVKWHRADRRAPFGAQKTREFQGPTPPTCPSNGYARIQNIMHRAV